MRLSALWRLAIWIAIIRIAAIWLAMVWFRSSAWPQVAAFFLAMLCLPEIYLVGSTRHQPILWASSASVVLAGGSIGWAALILWIRGVASRSGSRNT